MKHLVLLMLSSLAILLTGCGSAGSSTGGAAIAPPTSGVTIQLDAATYSGTATIHAIIVNALTTPIFAHDTASGCTILILEQQINGAWQSSDAARCPLKRPTQIVQIGAGQSLQVDIAATYPGMSTTLFTAGTYRLVLPYSTSSSTIPGVDGTPLSLSTAFIVQ